jgi:hypothetical protein
MATLIKLTPDVVNTNPQTDEYWFDVYHYDPLRLVKIVDWLETNYESHRSMDFDWHCVLVREYSEIFYSTRTGGVTEPCKDNVRYLSSKLTMCLPAIMATHLTLILDSEFNNGIS